MTEFKTLDLAKKYYKESKDLILPRHLKDQFLRSTSSISLNLAEGNTKFSTKERLRYFEIAYGSFRESQTILELENIKNEEIDKIADHLGASLYKLTRALITQA